MSEEQRAFPRAEDYDPGRLLTHMALLFVGLLVVFVSFIIGVQIYKSGEANTESWAALTGLIGWATAQVSTIMGNRFGTTKQAEKKDAMIERQARTIATGTGSGTNSVIPAPRNTEIGAIPAAEVVTPKEEVK